MMRIPSSTVSPVVMMSFLGSTMTSPRYRLLVGTKTVTISRFPAGVSTTTSEVTKPKTNSPSRGCSARTTALKDCRFSGEHEHHRGEKAQAGNPAPKDPRVPGREEGVDGIPEDVEEPRAGDGGHGDEE